MAEIAVKYLSSSKYMMVLLLAKIVPMVRNPIGTIVDVLGHLNIVDITSSFPTTVPIYGLVAVNMTRTAECYVNFKTDSNHTLRLNIYYMYWGYQDGGSGYVSVSSSWRSMENNRYLTFFDDSRSNPYVDTYVNFTIINGSRPANYKTGYLFALVDSRDIS